MYQDTAKPVQKLLIMEGNTSNRKTSKFQNILSSIRKRFPDRETWTRPLMKLIGVLLFMLTLIGLFFFGIWSVATYDNTSFVQFDSGNGKQTTLLMSPDDKVNSIEPLLREKLNLSSDYTIDFYVGDYKLDPEKALKDYKLMRITGNAARFIPVINVRFSCSECLKEDQHAIGLGTDTNTQILRRIDELEKLFVKHILLTSNINRDKLVEGNPELQQIDSKEKSPKI